MFWDWISRYADTIAILALIVSSTKQLGTVRVLHGHVQQLMQRDRAKRELRILVVGHARATLDSYYLLDAVWENCEYFSTHGTVNVEVLERMACADIIVLEGFPSDELAQWAADKQCRNARRPNACFVLSTGGDNHRYEISRWRNQDRFANTPATVESAVDAAANFIMRERAMEAR